MELRKMSWSASWIKTFVSPQGKPTKTLTDARDYLLKLPSRHAEHDVQAAIEAVLMAAEGRTPMLHAMAGIGTVLNGRKGIHLPKLSSRPRWERLS
jgi:hypothetical protein